MRFLGSVFVFIFLFLGSFSQSLTEMRQLVWKQSYYQDINKEVFFFNSAVFEPNMPYVPHYTENFFLDKNILYDIQIKILKGDTFTSNINSDNFSDTVVLRTKLYTAAKKHYQNIDFVPIIHLSGNKYLRITTFNIVLEPTQMASLPVFNKTFTDSSVLSSGNWAKIKISQDGVYKLSYEDLVSMGFQSPYSVRVFGYGGGMLPILNNTDTYDDLPELAIYVSKGSDGIFNAGDYILFYAQGPTRWTYNSSDNFFLQTTHNYSDHSYYFVTCNNGQPKEIQSDISISDSPTHILNTFIDYKFHESNLVNLIQSGQQWYGEAFDYRIDNYNFSFSFPNLVTSNSVKVKMGLVARSSSTTNFTTQINGSTVKTSSLGPITLTNYTGDYANYLTDFFNYISNSSTLNFNLTYNYPDYSSQGWLDYICVNAFRQLSFTGSQIAFRNPLTIDTNNITEFQISNANSMLIVWDVTDPLNPIKESLYDVGTNIKAFKTHTDSLPIKQFVAFDFSGFLSPIFVKKVANQNIHEIQDLDLVIVTPDEFKTQADELAQLHREKDQMNVGVFTNEEIYNEFSSGTPDVAAIRNMARMFYNRSSNFKYLLLYGDGSYDNKTVSTANSNYILTYQSPSSLSQSGSFVTDDFYGLLDLGEGGSSGYLDIGIGRLPVRNQSEADAVLNKIKHYYDPSTMGDWRNVVTFIGDDEDSNLHIDQANNLATQVDTSHPEFNVEKIFLDAYEQISTSSGESYPDAKEAIDNRMKKGCLIMNYTGHGGERGLTAEYVITIDGIKQWDNFDKLPLFVTATCEFSRYDDFEYTSAGESVLLNPKGGGIGLFTTTRLVYAGPNYVLNEAFYNYVFANNYNYRLGDLVRLTKIASGSSINKRNFSLLGDPAIKLAYPRYHAVATNVPDTLIPMTKATISGEIQDNSGQKLTNFNGIIYPAIFDKRDTITTLSNDGNASPSFKFSVQNKIIYKGKASVRNGEFSFSFIVPKDISYKNGYGKLSFYANDSLQDAFGYNDTIFVGGTAINPIYDDEGPDIELYINTLDFQDGGITNESPVLLAYVSDSTGINTVGNGIGHDITAILDGNSSEAIVLNEFYESDLDNYQKGKVIYYFNDLPEGFHTLTFKVWDVMNNSSEQDISFEVVKSSAFVIENVFNYPNPFSEFTNFYFDHNQAEEELSVALEIYDIMGRTIRKFEQTIYPDGYRSGPIVWDGKTAGGEILPPGIYPYKITVKLTGGSMVQKSNKLVIVR